MSTRSQPPALGGARRRRQCRCRCHLRLLLTIPSPPHVGPLHPFVQQNVPLLAVPQESLQCVLPAGGDAGGAPPLRHPARLCRPAAAAAEAAATAATAAAAAAEQHREHGSGWQPGQPSGRCAVHCSCRLAAASCNLANKPALCLSCSTAHSMSSFLSMLQVAAARQLTRAGRPAKSTALHACPVGYAPAGHASLLHSCRQ